MYKAAVERLYRTVKSTVEDLSLPTEGDDEPSTRFGEYKMPPRYWTTP